MRRLSASAILLVLALTTGGCDDDAGGDGDPSGDEPASPAALDSALLTLDDMPGGWSEVRYDAEAESNVCPAELAGPLGLDAEPPTAAAQYAASQDSGPSFAEAIQLVPSGRGGELMPIVRDALAACDGEAYGSRTARVVELDFPELGDESAAYTIRLGDVAIQVVYVVSGDIAMVMSSYDLTGGDPVGLLETYAAPAVDKAENVLG
jgi:hypothetical protein